VARFENVIVGGGLAGGMVAQEYREQGGDGSTLIVSHEQHTPYHRPPLTKDFLRGETPVDQLAMHPADWWREHDVELRDLRRPPAGLNVPTGENLAHGATTILTVGSDCAIGKMTVSLELDREARRRGIRSEFVPTGQTGIAIAGWGISVDAVVSDFLAGASEQLVVEGYPGHPLPSLAELVRLHEEIALRARPAKVVAVALNTAGLDTDEAAEAVADAARETGLPTADPVRDGAASLLDAVLSGT